LVGDILDIPLLEECTNLKPEDIRYIKRICVLGMYIFIFIVEGVCICLFTIMIIDDIIIREAAKINLDIHDEEL